MTDAFHLAIAQAPAELSGGEARLDWLRGLMPDLAAGPTDLVLLPELFANGYHIGADIVERAETATGPTAEAIAALAQQHGVAIHYGFAERDGQNLYNSAQCFGPDGSLLGKQRKLAIPPGFERDYFSPGQGCTLFDYRGLRFATLICYDAEFPETVRYVAGKGADVVLVPTALGYKWAWVADTMIPTRAYENGVYLAYANSAGVERGMSFLGKSVIAAPDGQEAARAGPLPQIIHARLEKSCVHAAQQRLPYLNDHKTLQLGS